VIKIWSELPGARIREVVADVATVAWVWFWGSLALRVYDFLVSFAEAGRLVRGGGEALQDFGVRAGESLRGLPVVGEAAAGALTRGFAGASTPIVSAGRELESFVIIVALTLGLLLAAVPLVPWLARYLPWRAERLRRIRSAHKAIRTSPASAGVRPAEVERVLAGRALNRLEWADLLEYTNDPIGDWQRGRYDRLVRAEMEQAGLRP
jgi:hypothetical protein